jgi:hypothetical protein
MPLQILPETPAVFLARSLDLVGLRPGYLQICRRSCKMRTTWSVPQHIFNKHCRASTDSLGCRSCMGCESNSAGGPLSVLHPGVWPGSCGCA